jgi:hypothetical protein
MKTVNVLIKSADKVEKVWNERIASIPNLTTEDIDALNAQKELLMEHANGRFVAQVNVQGIARLALPLDDKQLLLLNIPVECVDVLD